MSEFLAAVDAGAVERATVNTKSGELEVVSRGRTARSVGSAAAALTDPPVCAAVLCIGAHTRLGRAWTQRNHVFYVCLPGSCCRRQGSPQKCWITSWRRGSTCPWSRREAMSESR
jgi:hypothetical protein